MGYQGNRGGYRRANPTGPATENRFNFVTDLLRKRVVSPEDRQTIEQLLANWGNPGGLTNNQASFWITELCNAPEKPQPGKVTKTGEYQLPDNHPTHPGEVAIVRQRRDKSGFWAGIKGGDRFVKGLIDDIHCDWRLQSAAERTFGIKPPAAQPAPADDVAARRKRLLEELAALES